MVSRKLTLRATTNSHKEKNISFFSSDSTEHEQKSLTAPSVAATHEEAEQQKRGLRFWTCIISLMVASFLMMFELVPALY